MIDCKLCKVNQKINDSGILDDEEMNIVSYSILKAHKGYKHKKHVKGISINER